MSTTKITAPVKGYTGSGAAGVQFKDGVAHTDNEAAIVYFRAAGYGIGSEKPTVADVDEPVDPREVDDLERVGTRLRDAAVDPEKDDFLPPTNAGKANPHGPLVVSPGIHAIETQVIRPGVVHVDDIPAQQKAETAQAEALLVERRSVEDVIAVPADADRGPDGLSDPGSAETGETDSVKKTAAKRTTKKTAAKRSRS